MNEGENTRRPSADQDPSWHMKTVAKRVFESKKCCGLHIHRLFFPCPGDTEILPAANPENLRECLPNALASAGLEAVHFHLPLLFAFEPGYPMLNRLLVLTLFAAAWLISSPVIRSAPEPAADEAAKSPITFESHIVPLVQKYCVGCHGGMRPRARLSLELYKTDASLADDLKVWENVLRNVRKQDMPPKDRTQPAADELALLTSWLDTRLTKARSLKRDPGNVTMRRLNRTEYNNTIRDLVGVTFQPANDFPADDVGYGFDNIGDVLTVPPILMEKYLIAAEKIVDAALQDPELKKRIYFIPITDQEKEEATRKILERFATRAYRRSLRPEELPRLLHLVHFAEKQGDSWDKGVQLALQAILASPFFLFRIETDRRPNDPDSIHAVNEFELATRLSYFLWSSMPDDDLFEQARAGTLHDNLESQARRLLRDPKADALVKNFSGQWLQTRNLATINPDPALFPNFDEDLRAAMLKETDLFFEHVMRNDCSVLDFLDSDYTFANERLARHYGIDGIRGNQFQRVELKGHHRGGILTQASILTATSNPTRTSPVKRGKWILENILGAPPPPPPPDVPELKEDKELVLTGSLRKRMEQHRADPNCAVCHQKMDTLGFGFENFDAIGGWRQKDGNFAIDAAGTLPNGQSFQGPRELKAILKTQKDDYCRCLTEKMLTYAIGRGLEYYDKSAVDQVVSALAKSDYRFSTLILEIIKSEPFQKRRGQKGEP